MCPICAPFFCAKKIKLNNLLYYTVYYQFNTNKYSILQFHYSNPNGITR